MRRLRGITGCTTRCTAWCTAWYTAWCIKWLLGPRRHCSLLLQASELRGAPKGCRSGEGLRGVVVACSRSPSSSAPEVCSCSPRATAALRSCCVLRSRVSVLELRTVAAASSSCSCCTATSSAGGAPPGDTPTPRAGLDATAGGCGELRPPPMPPPMPPLRRASSCSRVSLSTSCCSSGSPEPTSRASSRCDTCCSCCEPLWRRRTSLATTSLLARDSAPSPSPPRALGDHPAPSDPAAVAAALAAAASSIASSSSLNLPPRLESAATSSSSSCRWPSSAESSSPSCAFHFRSATLSAVAASRNPRSSAASDLVTCSSACSCSVASVERSITAPPRPATKRCSSVAHPSARSKVDCPRPATKPEYVGEGTISIQQPMWRDLVRPLAPHQRFREPA
eukprot:scaffold38870_cov51-Phaeocystis_antarctica.AAC.1